MSKEIKIENDDYGAVFVIDNGKDYDICQLFEKDKVYGRTVVKGVWIKRDLFNIRMREKNQQISDLESQLEACMYARKLAIEDKKELFDQYTKLKVETDEAETKYKRQINELEHKVTMLYNIIDYLIDEYDLYWLDKTASERGMTLIEYVMSLFTDGD